MKSIVYLLAFLALTLVPALAQDPLALVTEIKGSASQSGKPLQLFQYLQAAQLIEVKSGGMATFSYVVGGVRVTAIGPCELKLEAKGPVLQKGEKSQVNVLRPERRVGVALPSSLDLGTGGHLRRGELSLHLSHKILPGEQAVAFTALPSFRDFRLTVSNSSTFQEVFQQDQKGKDPFILPKGCLEPGQSYDFLLQGTTDSGQNMEIEQESVVVLSEELAQLLEGEHQRIVADDTDFAGRAELLARYLKHGVDDRALLLTEELLALDQANVQLENLKLQLRERLGYQ